MIAGSVMKYTIGSTLFINVICWTHDTVKINVSVILSPENKSV
jgi:hypothetical protein